MKSRVMIGLLIAGVLVIPAAAQDNGGRQSMDGVIVSLPRQPSSNTDSDSVQLQAPSGSRDATAYAQVMEAVLQALSEDLVQIAQAAHDAKISRAQAEYLSVEGYYMGLMRFRLLRALYQNADDANQREPYPQANTAAPTSDTVVVVAPSTSSRDVSQQIVNYLELSPAQLAGIQAQIADDRQRVQPLLDQLETSRRNLISITLNGHFDAEQVQALAAEQSQIVERLIVANAQLATKVYSMLTSDQQRKLDELRRQTLTSVKASFPDW